MKGPSPMVMAFSFNRASSSIPGKFKVAASKVMRCFFPPT